MWTVNYSNIRHDICECDACGGLYKRQHISKLTTDWDSKFHKAKNPHTHTRVQFKSTKQHKLQHNCVREFKNMVLSHKYILLKSKHFAIELTTLHLLSLRKTMNRKLFRKCSGDGLCYIEVVQYRKGKSKSKKEIFWKSPLMFACSSKQKCRNEYRKMSVLYKRWIDHEKLLLTLWVDGIWGYFSNQYG